MKLVIAASHASLLIFPFRLFCWYNSVRWTIAGHTLQSLVGGGTGTPVSRNCIRRSFFSSIVFATKEPSATIRPCFENFLTSFPRRYSFSMIDCLSKCWGTLRVILRYNFGIHLTTDISSFLFLPSVIM